MAVDNDFSAETVQALPLLASQAKNFNIVSGSPDVMTLVDGITQDVELSAGNGGGWLAYLIAPTSVNQACECKVYSASSGLPSTAKMGVFARLTDIDNFVGTTIDLNTGRLEVFQRVAGVTTTLANPTTALTAATIKGGSVRLECIGRFARYWINPRFYKVDDAPPDGVVELLSDPDPDDPGEWGIFAESNSSGTKFRAAHFYARELPNVYLPPPFTRIGNAGGQDFKPITSTVSAVPSDAIYIEWELAPADPDDFAEVYRDIAPAALTSRVLWARAGYAYDVRARPISELGVRGDWTTTKRITASGSLVPPTAQTFPDDVFPDVAPDFILEHTQTAAVSATISGTQRERLTDVPGQPRPRRRWTLGFVNRQRGEIAMLSAFVQEMQGMVKPWVFTHPTSGELVPMRFASDEPQFDIIDEGTASPVFVHQIDIVEAYVGGTATLAPTFELDASF